MNEQTTVERIEALRQEALDLEKEAWRRIDGGQELTLRAMELEREADRIDAALSDPAPAPRDGGPA